MDTRECLIPSFLVSMTFLQANLAFNRVTSQTGQKPGTTVKDWGSSMKAVDGNPNPNFEGQSCTHTDNVMKPYWRVWVGRFGRKSNLPVHYVMITNRILAFGRLHNFAVYVVQAGRAERHLCYHFHGVFPPGTRLLKCKDDTPEAALVEIKLLSDKKEILTLCEVAVFDAYPGWYRPGTQVVESKVDVTFSGELCQPRGPDTKYCIMVAKGQPIDVPHCPTYTKFERCTIPPKIDDFEYTLAWNEWSPCSTTCGEGVRQKEEICEEPEFLGTPCPRDYKSTKKTSICSSSPCPSSVKAYPGNVGSVKDTEEQTHKRGYTNGSTTPIKQTPPEDRSQVVKDEQDTSSALIPVVTTLTVLIVLGGLGFFVWYLREKTNRSNKERSLMGNAMETDTKETGGNEEPPPTDDDGNSPPGDGPPAPSCEADEQHPLGILSSVCETAAPSVDIEERRLLGQSFARRWRKKKKKKRMHHYYEAVRPGEIIVPHQNQMIHSFGAGFERYGTGGYGTPQPIYAQPYSTFPTQPIYGNLAQPIYENVDGTIYGNAPQQTPSNNNHRSGQRDENVSASLSAGDENESTGNKLDSDKNYFNGENEKFHRVANSFRIARILSQQSRKLESVAPVAETGDNTDSESENDGFETRNYSETKKTFSGQLDRYANVQEDQSPKEIDENRSKKHARQKRKDGDKPTVSRKVEKVIKKRTPQKKITRKSPLRKALKVTKRRSPVGRLFKKKR